MWKNIKIDEDFTLNVFEADEQQPKTEILVKNEAESGELVSTSNIKPETGRDINTNESQTSGVISDLSSINLIKKETQVIDLTDDDISDVKKEPIIEINLTNDDDMPETKIELKEAIIPNDDCEVIVITDDVKTEKDPNEALAVINSDKENSNSDETLLGREIIRQIIKSISDTENGDQRETAVSDATPRPIITVRPPEVINSSVGNNCPVRLVQPAPSIPEAEKANPALQVPVIVQNSVSLLEKPNGGIVGDALRSLLTVQSPHEQEMIGKFLKNILSEDKTAPSLTRNMTSSSSEFQSPKRTKIPQNSVKKSSTTKNKTKVVAKSRPKINKKPLKKPSKEKTKIVMTPTGVKIANPEILFLSGQEKSKTTSDFFVRSSLKRSLDSQLKDKKNELSPAKKNRTESLSFQTLPETSPNSRTSSWVKSHFHEKPKTRGRKPKTQPQTPNTLKPKTQVRKPRRQPKTPNTSTAQAQMPETQPQTPDASSAQAQKPKTQVRKPRSQPKTPNTTARAQTPKTQPQTSNTPTPQAEKPKTQLRKPRRQSKTPETPIIPEAVPETINDTCKIIGEFLNGVFNPNSVQSESLPSFLGRCYGTQLVNMYLSLNGKKQNEQ
ncbi:proteoglycan 4-like [Tribolium madens]|uniref:proteoglycan 4-like n=1 Tax=Tribolium madens TaxID=41895 RepID=UPI001CF75C1E|nr:proteoglycan 4-like [Tribolium madens]XP_044260762.1 proteoglycan 4-like [Tribolium madens]